MLDYRSARGGTDVAASVIRSGEARAFWEGLAAASGLGVIISLTFLALGGRPPLLWALFAGALLLLIRFALWRRKQQREQEVEVEVAQLAPKVNATMTLLRSQATVLRPIPKADWVDFIVVAAYVGATD